MRGACRSTGCPNTTAAAAATWLVICCSRWPEGTCEAVSPTACCAVLGSALRRRWTLCPRGALALWPLDAGSTAR